MANPGDRVTFEGKLAIAGNHIWLIGAPSHLLATMIGRR